MALHPGQRRPAPLRHPIRGNLGEQLHAGFGGFVDEATLGLFDPIAAGVNALRRAKSPRELRDAYLVALAQEQAADRRDLAAHPYARRVGQGVGTLTSIAASVAAPQLAVTRTLAPGLRLAAGRLPKAVAAGIKPRVDHVLRLGAVTGAGSGAAGQLASDLVSGRRSPMSDYVGAGLGGVVGGVTAPILGGGGGGAVEGALTPAIQAVLNGRKPELDAIFRGAGTGGAIGGLAGGLAVKHVEALPMKTKGKLGDALSAHEAFWRGERVAQTQRREYLPSKNGSSGWTNTDLTTVPLWQWSYDKTRKFAPGSTRPHSSVEAKFGYGADLSKRQLEALNGGLNNFRAQHWLPRDFGVAGAVAAGLAKPWWDNDDE